VGAGRAVLVLAAYGLAFIAGPMLVVRRRDITYPDSGAPTPATRSR
jgi:hypothetical protein